MTTLRKNITQPADWWAAFQQAADAENATLSEWVGEACLERLPARGGKKLSERPPAHRPRPKDEK